MSTSKKNWCIKDVNTYKALSDRWKVQRCLRAWWASLSKEAQAIQYRKWHNVSTGTKRSFDTVMLAEKTTDRVGEEDRKRMHWMPWWLWRDNKLAAGRTLPQCEEEWKAGAHAGNTDAEYEDGEWHLPVRIGIIRDKLRTRTQESEQSRSVEITNVEQLQQLQAASTANLDAWWVKHLPARTDLGTDNIPILDVQETDSVTRAAPKFAGHSAIQREVTCRLGFSLIFQVTEVTW